jgi:hypothetical protein
MNTNVPPEPPPGERSKVTDLASRRRRGAPRHTDVLQSITFVFDGVHYGTVPISMPYTRGKPIVLYIVPERDHSDDELQGPVDCLLTDDTSLGANRTDIEVAQ